MMNSYGMHSGMNGQWANTAAVGHTNNASHNSSSQMGQMPAAPGVGQNGQNSGYEKSRIQEKLQVTLKVKCLFKTCFHLI